ncbi:dTMP kinase [cyanobacterium TDX16]|nr:dTMP kinase [cyanobacterium TDX16]
MNLPGKLIVFEGVEGSGKTTQIQATQSWLREILSSTTPKRDVIVTREPGGTQLGAKLRSLLLESRGEAPILSTTELLLYAADRAQHVEETLKVEIAFGTIILCDRYTDSTIAYQGYGRGLDLNLIHQLNAIATAGLKSDLTIWLDLDVEVGLSRTKGRGSNDRIEQEAIAFHRRVQQGYSALARQDPYRIVRVDASLSESEVRQQIQTILRQHLAEILR